MKHILTLLTFLLPVIFSSVRAKAFPLTGAGIDTTSTAVIVYDLRFNTPLICVNPDMPLIPASITKAVTAASVLNLADSDERFMTAVVTDGSVKESTLYGNIIVMASGDPTIESEHFSEACGFADSIAVALSKAGIARVEGDVVIDESSFIHSGTPAGWMKEDLTWPYGTDLHGANFRDNKFILRMPSRATSPHVPDLSIRHINPKAKARSIKRHDGSTTVTISGRIPPKGWSEKLSMPNPASVMRHEILMSLKSHDIEITASPSGGSGSSALIYTHLSPRFGDILKSLMARSDNLMAEGMLRSLTPSRSRSDAIAEEMKIWTDKGIPVDGIHLEDGSGLSRNDRLTARFMLRVLQEMNSLDYGTDYTSLFPLAGRDGTMKSAFTETILEGRAAFKTGSMKGVRSFAGYVMDEFGTPSHIVVVISNNLKSKSIRQPVQDMLLDIIH